MRKKTAGILSTGTEILQGLYADTNAQWFAARLSEAGIPVRMILAAPDRPGEVARSLRHLAEHCEIILMTGGLGPTEDDLTRQAVCEVFGGGLQEDAETLRMIQERFVRWGRKIPASNRVQCLIPEKAKVLRNHWGTAAGFLMEERLPCGEVFFAALPGPPRENRPMYQQYLEKTIAERYAGKARSLIKVLHTFAVSESELNDRLRDLSAALKKEPGQDLAFLAGKAQVDLRLMARGGSAAKARGQMRSLEAKVRRRVPADHLYGVNDETLEGAVLEGLRRRGWRLATAESCTGGLVSKRLTDIPGSSDVFLQGWVTYTNDAKTSQLGVRRPTLDARGAVSAEVAGQMAQGALKKSGADVAVAITGIAGPDGGTEEKPVGLIYYGLAWREKARIQVCVARTTFASSRELTRLFASHMALDLVRRLCLDLPLDFLHRDSREPRTA